MKLIFVLYLLVSMLPTVSYIASIYFISISRQSFGFLAILLVLLVHPIVSVPIGVVTKVYHERLMKLKTCPKMVLRFLTFSINCYFALIMLIMLYLYNMWIYIKHTSDLILDLDYTNQAFDQCACENYEDCSAETSDFQNILSSIEIGPFLYLFVLNPMICHIVHSFCTFLPEPIPLLDFILCKKTETIDQDTPPEPIHLQELTESRTQSNHEEHLKLKNRPYICVFISCLLLTFTYILIILGSPIGFRFLVKEPGNITLGISSCPTKGLKSCEFPFKFNDRLHFGCIDDYREDLRFGSIWCPITKYTDKNGNPKTVGICQTNCPGGMSSLHENEIKIVKF